MLFPTWLVAAVISKPHILRLLGNYLHVSYSLFQCKGDFHAKQVIYSDYFKNKWLLSGILLFNEWKQTLPYFKHHFLKQTLSLITVTIWSDFLFLFRYLNFRIYLISIILLLPKLLYKVGTFISIFFLVLETAFQN